VREFVLWVDRIVLCHFVINLLLHDNKHILLNIKLKKGLVHIDYQ
jgi:hypothetical protein